MTSCVKCGRPVKDSGKVAHLLCQKCRAPKREPTGRKTHIVDEASVARLRCQVSTLCGRSADSVKTAPEKNANCLRCQKILGIRARNHAYKMALRMVAMAAGDLVTKGDPDHLLCEGLTQISQELALRANGQLQARVIGPEILKRAAARKASR